MTILILYFCKNNQERIPGVLLGLILDGVMVVGIYEIVIYHINYFGL